MSWSALLSSSSSPSSLLLLLLLLLLFEEIAAFVAATYSLLVPCLTMQTDVGGLQGRTPLHRAAYTNDLESIKLLLHHGADATATDYQVHCFDEQTCQQLLTIQEGLTAHSFLTKQRCLVCETAWMSGPND